MKKLKTSRVLLLCCLLLTILALTAALTLSALADDATTAFTGTTLTLTDGTNIRFAGTLAQADRDDAVFVYTFCGKTYMADIIADSDGAFTADVPVGAAEMAQTITAKIMVGGTEKDTITQSVKGYALTRLAEENASDTEKLIVSQMLRYGAEAYEYLNSTESDILDGLTLPAALEFPAEPTYVYTKDATGIFTKIQLTLTEALRLTLKNETGDVTVTHAVKISQFFDGIDAEWGGACVTASPSLYTKLEKNNAKTGDLVKALYNYAVAVHIAISRTQPQVHQLSYTQDTDLPHMHNSVCSICQKTVSDAHTLGEAVIDKDMCTITYACTACSASLANTFMYISDFSEEDTGIVGLLCDDNGEPTLFPTYDNKAYWITSSADRTHVSADAGFCFYPAYEALDDANVLVLGFDVIMPEGGFSQSSDTAALELVTYLGAGEEQEDVVVLKPALLAKETALYMNDEKITECVADQSYNIVIEYHLVPTFSGCDIAYTVYFNGAQVYDVTQTYEADCADAFYSELTQIQFKFSKESWNMHNDTGIIYDNIYYTNTFIDWENQ